MTWPEIGFVEAMEDLESFLVEVDHLCAVFGRELVIAKIVEAVEGWSICCRFGDHKVGFSYGLQEFKNALEVLGVARGELIVDSEIKLVGGEL